jgi:hypothetical protein
MGSWFALLSIRVLSNHAARNHSGRLILGAHHRRVRDA